MKKNNDKKATPNANVTTAAERNNLPIQQPEKPYEPSEMVIKEMMIQKQVTRDEAISILKNPKK